MSVISVPTTIAAGAIFLDHQLSREVGSMTTRTTRMKNTRKSLNTAVGKRGYSKFVRLPVPQS